MKCPHCEYRHGWCWWSDARGNESYDYIDGGMGEFYVKSSKFTRQVEPFNAETVSSYACPCCRKTFIVC